MSSIVGNAYENVPKQEHTTVPKDKRRYIHPENQREINLNLNVLIIAVRGLTKLGVSEEEIMDNVGLAVSYETSEESSV